MGLAKHRPVFRLGRTLALVAGACLIPVASTSGVKALLPAAVVAPATGPEALILAQADKAPVTRPVAFSAEQAERGKNRYDRYSEECHRSDLGGGMNGGAPLIGLAFEEKFA